VLRFTETDHWGTTNSKSSATLMDLTYRSAWLTGHSFDPSGRTFGITPMLEQLLGQAGFQHIGTSAHAINFSSGTEAHSAMYQNFRVFFKLVQPFVLKTRRDFSLTDMPQQEELDQLYEQMLLEMYEDFVGLFYLLSAWGEKP